MTVMPSLGHGCRWLNILCLLARVWLSALFGSMRSPCQVTSQDSTLQTTIKRLTLFLLTILFKFPVPECFGPENCAPLGTCMTSNCCGRRVWGTA